MLEFEKWIGEKDDTSGSYYERGTKELQVRKGGKSNSKRLYRFNSRFGETYYITDNEVIRTIEEMLANQNSGVDFVEYLYNLIIEKFGVIGFLSRVGHRVAEQRDEGYRQGKLAKQKEIIEALGLN